MKDHSPQPGIFCNARVLVTGGTSGLGRALVAAFNARGARVAFVARTAARVAQVAAEEPGTLPIVADIADKTAIHAIALLTACSSSEDAGRPEPVESDVLKPTACRFVVPRWRKIRRDADPLGV